MSSSATKSLLLALALLAAVELAGRFFFSRSLAGRFEYGYNPTVGFEEEPNGTVNLVRTGGRRFFPQSFSRQRPQGVFRIAVVGDSVARGPNLSASYAVQLAEVLRREGIQAEGLNLSLGGYGAQRKEIVLEQALKYQPSLVILHLNNSNEFEDEREYKRAVEFKSWHPRNWPMKSLVLRRLYEAKTEQIFWNWLPQEVRIQQAVSDADAETVASLNAGKLKEWDERVKRFTAESVALARSKQVPMLLVAKARMIRDAPGKARLADDGLDQLARSFNGPGVWSLSMKAVLEPLDYEKLFSDTTHMRREGHAVLARAIAAFLKENGVLNKP